MKNLHKKLKKMTRIRLHFYRWTRFFSKLIQWRTFSEFSHCSIELDGIIYESKEFIGVRKIKALKTPPKSLVCTVEKSITREQYEIAKKWLEMQKWKGYDYSVVTTFVWLPKMRKNNDKYWCSEFLCVFCETIGMIEKQKFPTSPWTMYLLLK